jgi:hypothetical protein
MRGKRSGRFGLDHGRLVFMFEFAHSRGQLDELLEATLNPQLTFLLEMSPKDYGWVGGERLLKREILLFFGLGGM